MMITVFPARWKNMGVKVKNSHNIAVIVPNYFSLNKSFPLLLSAKANGIFPLQESSFTTFSLYSFLKSKMLRFCTLFPVMVF